MGIMIIIVIVIIIMLEQLLSRSLKTGKCHMHRMGQVEGYWACVPLSFLWLMLVYAVFTLKSTRSVFTLVVYLCVTCGLCRFLSVS